MAFPVPRELKLGKEGQVTQRYPVTISLSGAGQLGTGRFSQTINIPFEPDIMIVRSVLYYNDQPAPGENPKLTVVRMDLVNDYICSFANFQVPSIPQTTFMINKQVKGLQTFSLVAPDLSTIDDSRQGDLVIQLEFQQFGKGVPGE